MGKIPLIKGIRSWASQHESTLSDLKYLKGAKCLAERLYEEFFEAAEKETELLREQSRDLRMRLTIANGETERLRGETERLRGDLTGLFEQQDAAWPIVSGDALRNVLNYAVCIQNDLTAIEDSAQKEYFKKIHDRFQRICIEINGQMRSWAETLAETAEISSAAVSVIDFVED